LLIVVKRPGTDVSKQEILNFYEGRITKMHIPDDVEFVDAMPIGATGKVQKSELRETFKGLRFV
jgi:fatty-acyl-CoA synthase